jgi:hypothetical protein
MVVMAPDPIAMWFAELDRLGRRYYAAFAPTIERHSARFCATRTRQGSQSGAIGSGKCSPAFR